MTNQFRKLIKIADPATLTPEDLVGLLDLYAAAIKLRDFRNQGGVSPPCFLARPLRLFAHPAPQLVDQL